MRIPFSQGGRPIGSAEVDSLPGCTQIAVLHSAFISPKFRSKGWGKLAHKERLDKVFNEFGYDMAIVTVDEENDREISILEQSGWTQVSVFISRKTRHAVGLWIKAAASSAAVAKTYDDYVEEMENNA